jgi:uncharacterized membrane protein (UPF0127 family)
MHHVTIRNPRLPAAPPIRANLADSFWSRFRGLMFSRPLAPDTGLLLVENSESVVNSAIHMLFMNFDITTVWLDTSNRVVDVILAKRWRLAYAPKAPAKSILECHTDRLADFHPGDLLIIENA